MKFTFAIGAFTLTALLLIASEFNTPASADRGNDRFTIGPDVAVSRLGLSSGSSEFDDFHYYGTHDGIAAFSMASTSCNVGDQRADWIDGPQARNPVIAQNIYRLKDGRFEHVGMSWLKHSFCAVSEPTCGDCQATNCDTLGVGCADTYWATLNGSQQRLGPRWKINPQGQGAGGVHDDNYDPPQGNSTIRGRLQIHVDEIVDDAIYFAEIQYVTHDERLDRRWNNASYRPVDVTQNSISGIESGQESVRFEQPAIMGWAEFDPAVNIVAFEDVPGEGRFHLGYKVTDNGDGTWTYEYALHNMNSDRAAGAFSVPVGAANVLATGFHDVDYHSGDGIDYATFDGTDWAAQVGSGDLTWTTESHDINPNANALRWGSLYNFRFTADAPPVEGDISVGLFKPGTPDSVGVTALVPEPTEPDCPADLDGDDGLVNVSDLLVLLANWDTDGPGADIAEPNDLVEINDLLGLLSAWGECN